MTRWFKQMRHVDSRDIFKALLGMVWLHTLLQWVSNTEGKRLWNIEHIQPIELYIYECN